MIDSNGRVKELSGDRNVLHVDTSDVGTYCIYICEASIGATGMIKLESNQNIIIASDVEPSNPTIGDMWIDTSSGESVMKKYVKTYSTDTDQFSTGWIAVSSSASDIIQNAISQSADFYATKDSLNGYVTQQTYSEEMDRMTERIGDMELTSDKFKLMFSENVENAVSSQISGAVNDYKQ